ncbi:DNA-binding transcriptional regulator YiaG [Catalinimonas alkaloidigena]|uniref:hypothetical protein n=1 Tax=Catalinimonas alkaloidigena TaxID=1075417 RepID=UPI002404B544|nr:hypothetical protein [Catalinimonas alkaloidigena]MDF9800798.1 DNA-binding transcriptional regulator YiaG [Catalinimonas alkaloidigena]
MEETLQEKKILLADDIQSIHTSKDLYKLEDLANLYKVTVSTIKYIQRLSNTEVSRMSSLVVNKHQYIYTEDTPKTTKSKPKKSYYKKKKPEEKNYRKSSISDDKIRYIRKNPDQLKMRELAQLLDTTISAVDAIRQRRTCNYVSEEGSIYRPDPQEIEDIRNKSVYSQNTRRTLTPSQVLIIRKSNQSDIALAEKYGVSSETIRKVKRRLSYKHVIDNEKVILPDSALSDDKIRYIQFNYDQLTINQLSKLFKISIGATKYAKQEKKVSEEGPVYIPDPKKVENIKKKYPKKSSNSQKIFFTQEQIQEMKNSGLSARKLAKKYGVSGTTIRKNLGMK